MHDVLAQAVAELQALGIYGIGVISGLFLAALLGANREDNDK